MEHYDIYFRGNPGERWFGFGSCFSEKGAKILLAKYMLFCQDEGKFAYGVVGFVYRKSREKYEQILDYDSEKVVTLGMDEANQILLEEKE